MHNTYADLFYRTLRVRLYSLKKVILAPPCSLFLNNPKNDENCVLQNSTLIRDWKLMKNPVTNPLEQKQAMDNQKP